MKVMKQILLVCLVAIAGLIISSSPLHAQTVSRSQVVLMVSLDPDLYSRGVASWLHDYAGYPAGLESLFRQAFANSQYDVRVVQSANADDLYQVLHSANTAGVFWISHEAPLTYSGASGVQIDPLLVDENNADIKALFRDINPGIRWVSLVACESNLVVNWLNSGLHIQGFDQPIDAKTGLRQAIALSTEALSPRPDETHPTACPTASGVRASVTRSLSNTQNQSQFYPALMIENHGNIVGTFAAASLSPGESRVQNTTVYLDFTDVQLSITSGMDAGNHTAEELDLGNFQVTGNWTNALWRVFSKPDGTPFGVTERLLLFTGSKPAPMNLATYQPFQCR